MTINTNTDIQDQLQNDNAETSADLLTQQQKESEVSDQTVVNTAEDKDVSALNAKDINNIDQNTLNLINEHVNNKIQEYEENVIKNKLMHECGNAEEFNNAINAIKQWSKSYLPEELHNTLTKSYKGLAQIKDIITKNENNMSINKLPEQKDDIETLMNLMKTKEYRIDNDPKLIQRIQKGFASLSNK